MGTRALVGIENEDNSVSAIYNHWDGYVDGGLGQWLYENVKTRNHLNSIISKGSASSIINDEYYIDRGEELNIRKYNDVKVYSQTTRDFQYIYLYTLDGEWMVKTSDSGWTLLEDLRVDE